MDNTSPKILTTLQKEALDLLFSEEQFSKIFYLTGGTALSAFFLNHRHSDDLDFFTNAPDITFLFPLLKKFEQGGKLVIESRTPQYMRTRFKGELKIDFVQDIPFRVGIPFQHKRWKIDALENIALNKVSAIQGRLDVKDYVDLYFLLREDPEKIFPWLKQARQKDGSIEPFLWSRIIGDVETFRILPRMIKPFKMKDLVAFYRNLRQRILERLKPETG